MKLFVSPHNDDAALFGAFTLQREQPLVLTVFDSVVQLWRGHPACGIEQRRAEDLAAMKILDCTLMFGNVSDDDPPRIEIERALLRHHPSEVWLPAPEQGGHEQHNLVGEIGAEVYAGAIVHRYLTYTAHGKSRWGTKVPYTGAMLRRKLQALACYQTQIEIDALGCAEHFIRDQNEYMA